MSEVTREQLESAETRLGERVMGKEYRMGEAVFYLRALTNEDQLLVDAAASLPGERAARVAAAAEMICRLGITGWELHTMNGIPLPFETAKISRDGPKAVTVTCLRKLPAEVRRELLGEISSLKDLSEDEGLRLDFTIPKPDAQTQS